MACVHMGQGRGGRADALFLHVFHLAQEHKVNKKDNKHDLSQTSGCFNQAYVKSFLQNPHALIPMAATYLR